MIIKNAIIERADIDTERGLSAWLTLDYGGMHQGFGGYLLYSPKGWASHNKQIHNYGGHFLYRCLEIAGADKWSKLSGKTIRVELDNDGLAGRIQAIGHIVKDDWFNPSKDFGDPE